MPLVHQGLTLLALSIGQGRLPSQRPLLHTSTFLLCFLLVWPNADEGVLIMSVGALSCFEIC